MAVPPKRPGSLPPGRPPESTDDPERDAEPAAPAAPALPTGRRGEPTLNIPQEPAETGPTEVASDVPMTPLVPDSATGMFTPASLQRSQAMSGSAILIRGDKGPAVVELQRDLRALGLLPDEHLDDEEGLYGELTSEGVAAFQQDRDLPPTGNCDGRTRTLIRLAARET